MFLSCVEISVSTGNVEQTVSQADDVIDRLRHGLREPGRQSGPDETGTVHLRDGRAGPAVPENTRAADNRQRHVQTVEGRGRGAVRGPPVHGAQAEREREGTVTGRDGSEENGTTEIRNVPH